MKAKVLLGFVIALIALQFVHVERTNPITDESLELQATPEVMNILTRACYDCHSNQTKWPWYSQIAPFSFTISSHVNVGRKWVNFSIWNSYSKEKQQEIKRGMYRALIMAMPLKSYVTFHKEAQLTAKERQILQEFTGVKPYDKIKIR